MPYVIRAEGFANGANCPHAGEYLESFDFDGDEQGYGEFTTDLAKAKKFDTQAAALEFWKTRSRTRPTRRDGRPNRPLTALSISVKRVNGWLTGDWNIP